MVTLARYRLRNDNVVDANVNFDTRYDQAIGTKSDQACEVDRHQFETQYTYNCTLTRVLRV